MYLVDTLAFAVQISFHKNTRPEDTSYHSLYPCIVCPVDKFDPAIDFLKGNDSMNKE